jgi:hypothetical protein
MAPGGVQVEHADKVGGGCDPGVWRYRALELAGSYFYFVVLVALQVN